LEISVVKTKSRSIWTIGLALFAMFFGAGNLIFPLYVGQIAQDHSPSATIGFLAMGVLVPFLGVISMALVKGDYASFFGSLGKRVGFFITLLLLTVWIPLGSGPRCITLAYASLSSYVGLPPLWVVSIIYLGLVALMTCQRSRLLSILGFGLTPCLLLCLAIVIIKGIIGAGHEVGQAAGDGVQMALMGAKEGYNTMDLIASFFFSASIIHMLGREQRRSPIKTTILASLVGMSLLCIVYIGLIQLAAAHSEVLIAVPKDQILAYLAKAVLGPKVGITAALAIVLACFTTSVALTIVYVDFLAQSLFRNEKPNTLSLLITCAATFGMSILGLSGITAVTNPMLQIFYPMLILMICFQIVRRAIRANALRKLSAEPVLEE
jgi:branched-chain amino acid:cation transporter, LIVCS family